MCGKATALFTRLMGLIYDAMGGFGVRLCAVVVALVVERIEGSRMRR